MVIKTQGAPQTSSRHVTFAIFVAAFVVLIIITVSAAVPVIEHKYGMFVDAFPLSTVPEAYISISNPDPYLLKAISNQGFVFVPSSYSPKYDITSTYGNVTSWGLYSIEYEGNYYNIGVGSADPSSTPFFILYIVAPICWCLFGVSLLLYLRRQKRVLHR